MTLRAWLCRQPHPSSLLCALSDGGERKVRIGVSRSRWRDAEEACAGAVRVEALDEHGEVLRVIDLGEPESSSTSSSPSSSEGAMLERFATLLAEASDKAAARHEAAYRLGFEHLSALVQVLSQRLTALEAAWQKALMAAPASEESAADGQFLSQVMGLLGSSSPSSPSNANGAKKEGGA
jgi:hypothetical protein